jgi:hypothetical protein
MLTLIDTLDTLVVLGDKFEFRRAVRLVLDHADFDIDAEVSVFETTIRVRAIRSISAICFYFY